MTESARSMTAARNAELLSWYGEHARSLPWRESTDPYGVLVSEIMLQQTQAPRVEPRFRQFTDRWPTVDDLADATNDEVLGVWSGLGYNSRAIRLRDAARHVADYGWPRTSADLQTLPGVGPYTAAAIASISFGEQVPAVDTNLRRVLSRWAGEPLTGVGLQEFASNALAEPAGDWNQALMDLGSALCTPVDPDCANCPVVGWCADPTVYVAPAKQSRFEGSHRQLRGALVRGHLAGEDLIEVGVNLGRSTEETAQAIESLVAEGLLPAE